MGATIVTLASSVKQYLGGLVETADYAGIPMLDMHAVDPWPGGDTSIRFPVYYGRNASPTTFNEGAAPAASGNATFATCTLAHAGFYTRTVYQITGHAVDGTKNGWFDGIKTDASDALTAHMHYAEDLCVTTIESQISSSGSVYGQLRATVLMASYEAAVGTLALSDLQTLWETQRKLEVVMDMSDAYVASTIDMINEYNDVGTLIQYAEMPTFVNGVLDAGKLQSMPKYNGRPWIDVPTMTATTILLLKQSMMKKRVVRDVSITQAGITDDSVTTYITSAFPTWYTSPRYAAKIT